jgi:signal transduction histidine kinase
VRLADFIEANCEPILVKWVAFAETVGSAGPTMDLAALRDHALEMLQTIVKDLRTPESAAEQSKKSKGEADAPDTGTDAETAAEVHASVRAESGFTVGQMVSEYRALRASVIELWTKANGRLSGDDLTDLMRFNEAIDQAVAESVTRFTKDLDRSKEVFVAILGHDLRSPLAAFLGTSQFILDKGKIDDADKALLERNVRTAARMTGMVSDLLDFASSRLGTGIPIVRREMDLATEAAHAVVEVKAANAGTVIRLDTSGDLRGNWDAARIGQVLSNLLHNAVQHGTPKSPITVTVRGETKEVVVQVYNLGPAIPASALPGLFGPFKRLGARRAPPHPAGSLGLGLYIVDRIVVAHGGTITVDSDDRGTFFTVRFPR